MKLLSGSILTLAASTLAGCSLLAIGGTLAGVMGLFLSLLVGMLAGICLAAGVVELSRVEAVEEGIDGDLPELPIEEEVPPLDLAESNGRPEPPPPSIYGPFGVRHLDD